MVFKKKMFRWFREAPLLIAVLALGALLLLSGPALKAQETEEAAPQTPAVRILEVKADNIASLRTPSTLEQADAISLGVSRETLQADNAAATALTSWVRDGGVVFVYTDAAQLFGYETIAARPGSNRAAGQLFGRATAALPFGAHPLLWSGVPPKRGGGEDAEELDDFPEFEDVPELPALGIQKVFYQLAEGDHLVISHPAGVPLLRVSDPAVQGAQPLYSAAIAPFGNGWAVFTPRLVEEHRADGALFLQNLVRLASSRKGKASEGVATPNRNPGRSPADEALVSLPVPFIEKAADAARNETGYSALLPEWQSITADAILSAFTDPQAAAQTGSTFRLMLTAREMAGFGAALSEVARTEEADDTRFRALAFALRARVELQRGELTEARPWLELANETAPEAAEVLLWRGVWNAGSAQNVLLASPARGQLLAAAYDLWERALDAPQLIPSAQRQDEPPADNEQDDGSEFIEGNTVSGIPPQVIANWMAAARRIGELALVEPPLVRPIGREGRVVVLRHFPDDPTLRTAVPTGALLARADNTLGWGVEVEEILIFPDDEYYQEYSRAARIGSHQIAFSPLSDRGNVVGDRILMVSQMTVPVILDPGPPVRFGQMGSAVPAIIGRLHSQVLLNALTEDGGVVPAWMQLGLMSISNIAVASTLGNNEPVPEALAQTALAGGLLSPEEFQNINLGADEAGLVEAQARRLMLFFYAEFGPGAVVETLQRIGSGQTIEEALDVTTGLSEEEFFQNWYETEFSNRPVMR